jgi:hypothetical protein
MNSKTTACKESIMGEDLLSVGPVNLYDAFVPVRLQHEFETSYGDTAIETFSGDMRVINGFVGLGKVYIVCKYMCTSLDLDLIMRLFGHGVL